MSILPKSNFSKIHMSIAAFVIFSIISGISMNYGWIPGYAIRTLHFYSGILIVIAPSIVLAFLHKRLQTMHSYKAMILVNSMDFKRKRYFAVAAKLQLILFIALLLKQLLSGVLIGLRIFTSPDFVNALYDVHTFGILLIPVFGVLHIMLMIISRKAFHSKPSKQTITPPT